MRIPLLPSRASVIAVAALAAAASVALLLGVPHRWVAWPVAVGVAAGVLFALLDVWISARAWRAAPLQWRRHLPPAFALGVSRAVSGSLVNEGGQAWRLALFDGVDETLDFQGLPAVVQVPAAAALDLRYEVVPRRRGRIAFAPAELRVRTRGGSFELRRFVGDAEQRHVYPNFAAVARYAWLAGDRRLTEIGIKNTRQRGSGTDFKQLADYRPGDSLRRIDWKATLRQARPIVREYQESRDQRVLFLLDCGRRMRADEGTATTGPTHGPTHGSHFDEALNALMLLAYVALKDGDEVGALTFGHAPGEGRHFAPRKGLKSLNALIASLHDIEPRTEHSDFIEAAAELMRVQPKRSLVVVLTNFRDEDTSELAPALRLMRSRHLVLLASLRERALRETAEQPLTLEHHAIEAAGAHLFAQSRDAAFRHLAGRDGLLLDVEPAQLAAALVNRYQAVKRAGLL